MTPAKRAPAVVTREQLHAILSAGFSNWAERNVTIEDFGHRYARVRIGIDNSMLRPGGTVSGPVMFMAADLAFYIAVLASVGPQALAVTTNMNINFLRKPALADLLAECELLKLGKRLAVGEVKIFSAGEEEPVAHAAGTYSLPQITK